MSIICRFLNPMKIESIRNLKITYNKFGEFKKGDMV